MIQRLMACGLGLACALAVLFLVVFESRSADFNKDWLYEDLTCEEVSSGGYFTFDMLSDVIRIYNECQVFALSPADAGYGVLHCALIKKEVLFLQGMVKDLVAVYDAKKCDDK